MIKLAAAYSKALPTIPSHRKEIIIVRGQSYVFRLLKY
jgi:hypothetical protein